MYISGFVSCAPSGLTRNHKNIEIVINIQFWRSLQQEIILSCSIICPRQGHIFSYFHINKVVTPANINLSWALTKFTNQLHRAWIEQSPLSKITALNSIICIEAFSKHSLFPEYTWTASLISFFPSWIPSYSCSFDHCIRSIALHCMTHLPPVIHIMNE